MVVGKLDKDGWIERFMVGEYDGGGGLSEKLIFLPEIGDISSDFVSVSIPTTSSSIGGRRDEKGWNDGEKWIDDGGAGRRVAETGDRSAAMSHSENLMFKIFHWFWRIPK